jgi:DNA-binding MarR family transcriptional regulator
MVQDLPVSIIRPIIATSIVDMAIKPDIEDFILFQIDKTSKISKAFTQREFDHKALGITIDQWILLKIIDERMPISQKGLAKASHRDPASITRTMDLLERKGLIVRKVVPKNRRQNEVRLSAKGTQFVKDNMPLIRRHRMKSVEGFSVKEMVTLRTLLSRIQENLS